MEEVVLVELLLLLLLLGLVVVGGVWTVRSCVFGFRVVQNKAGHPYPAEVDFLGCLVLGSGSVVGSGFVMDVHRCEIGVDN